MFHADAPTNRGSFHGVLPQNDVEVLAEEEAVREYERRLSDPHVVDSSSTPQAMGEISVAHPANEDDNSNDDDETSCIMNRAEWTRMFCTAKWFMRFVCIYVLIQSMTVTGLFSSSLSTIETRYSFTSKQMGLLGSTYDIVVLVVSYFIAYYGSSVRGIPPRWLGSGMFIMGVGSVFFASPQFFSGLYKVKENGDADYCSSGLFTPDCSSSASNLLGLFFFAQVLIALGASPLYTLAPPYLDEVVEKVLLPMYLALFYATSALGPAFGFVFGGIFLDTWVDPGKEPEGINNQDPEWVGNWWLGYLLMGVLAMVFSVPLFLYPKFLPDTGHIREINKREARLLKRRLSQIGTPPESRTLWASVVAVMRNPTYVFNVLGQSTESFSVAGFSTFLPKAVESIFGLSAANASFAVGLTIIPGAAGGIFFGGWIIKRLGLTGIQTAKMAWMVALVALLFMIGFYVGCGTINLAGVTVPYNVKDSGQSLVPGVGGYQNLTSSCNARCPCDPDAYDPVCGDDGLVYFSACFAGCMNKTGTAPNQVYSDCTCVQSVAADAANGIFGSGGVSLGRCDTGCTALLPFLFLLFFSMFFTFANNVPATSVILRCLQPDLRSIGMGIQNMAFRLLGSIPGPIVFGAIIDSTCVLNETDCGSTTGSCWEYEAEDLRRNLVLLAVIPKLFSFIFFLISWYFFTSARSPTGLSPDVEASISMATR